MGIGESQSIPSHSIEMRRGYLRLRVIALGISISHVVGKMTTMCGRLPAAAAFDARPRNAAPSEDKIRQDLNITDLCRRYSMEILQAIVPEKTFYPAHRAQPLPPPWTGLFWRQRQQQETVRLKILRLALIMRQ